MTNPRKKNDLVDVLETCVSDIDLSVSQVGLSTDVRALHHNGALSARASCHQGAILVTERPVTKASYPHSDVLPLESHDEVLNVLSKF